ncbi:MAG: lipopolysaccharide heptosyltransferase II [Candidatus Omnitrophota bacterium]
MRVLLPQQRPPRILVTRADRIGDLVLATPVLESLRAHFPSAFIACLTFPENREILEGNPFIDQAIFYDKRGQEHGLWGTWRFARKLAREKFDLVIHLHATNRMHALGWLAGISQRIGYSRKIPWTLTQAIPDLKKEGEKHEAEYNYDLLESLGIFAPQILRPWIPLSDRHQSSVSKLLEHHRIASDRPWIALHPSASCPSKRWPAERFGKLCDCFGDAGRGPLFFVVGTREDRGLAARIQASASVPVHDWTGKLSLGMLAVFLSRCALLVTNDSGPAHVADAVGTPVVSIFGRNRRGLSPKRWRPLSPSNRIVWQDIGCDPCLAHHCEIDFLCLAAIPVREVFRHAEELLSRKGDGV